MARKPVGSEAVSKTLKPNDLKVGEIIEGYFMRTEDSPVYPGNHSLILKQEDGAIVRVSSHGNLKYRIQERALTLGAYTWITALGKATMKNGKPTTKFNVEQDDEKVTTGFGEYAPLTAGNIDSDGFDKIDSASSIKNAVEKSSNAALQANKVRQAMGRN